MFTWNLKDSVFIRNIIGSEAMLALIQEKFRELPEAKQKAMKPLQKQLYLITRQLTNIADKIQTDISTTYGKKQYDKLMIDIILFLDRASGSDEKCTTCMTKKDKVKSIRAGKVNEILNNDVQTKLNCCHKEVCKYSKEVCSSGCEHYEKIKESENENKI